MHESNVRFEHCYGLDFKQTVAARYRLRCWRSWLAGYSREQTRDRVTYADQRVASLEAGNTAPLTLDGFHVGPSADPLVPDGDGDAGSMRGDHVAEARASLAAVRANAGGDRRMESCVRDCELSFNTCQMSCSECEPCTERLRTCSEACLGSP